MEPRRGDRATNHVTLSTGQTVTLPLTTEATMTGAVFSAALDPVRALLPPGVSPVRIGVRTAVVTLLCVEYQRIDRGSIEPYNEFGVLIPAIRRASASGPIRSRFPGGIGGYVQSLPVTTEPARALGEEVWGYPKVVGEISITETDQRRCTRVRLDDTPYITVDIERPTITRTLSLTTESYTVHGGTVLREPLSFEGEMGVWPLSTRASYTLGPGAETLRKLDLGTRALCRFHGAGAFIIHPGIPV